MAKFLCSQLDGELNPAYKHCEDLSHLHNDCNCKEIYPDVLSTYDTTLETYLFNKIFDFIELGEVTNQNEEYSLPNYKETIEDLNKLTIID